MEKLVKKFEDIINISSGNFRDGTLTNELCAEEAKRIAIEFAKRMFRSKMMTQRKGFEEAVDTTPKEFNVVLGELTSVGGRLFEQFIEEEYK